MFGVREGLSPNLVYPALLVLRALSLRFPTRFPPKYCFVFNAWASGTIPLFFFVNTRRAAKIFEMCCVLDASLVSSSDCQFLLSHYRAVGIQQYPTSLSQFVPGKREDNRGMLVATLLKTGSLNTINQKNHGVLRTRVA